MLQNLTVVVFVFAAGVAVGGALPALASHDDKPFGITMVCVGALMLGLAALTAWRAA